MADLNACATPELHVHENLRRDRCKSHRVAYCARKNSISSHQSSTSVKQFSTETRNNRKCEYIVSLARPTLHKICPRIYNSRAVSKKIKRM